MLRSSSCSCLFYILKSSKHRVSFYPIDIECVDAACIGESLLYFYLGLEVFEWGALVSTQTEFANLDVYSTL